MIKFIVLSIALLLSGCRTEETEAKRETIAPWVERVRVEKDGVTCYVYLRRGISCVVLPNDTTKDLEYIGAYRRD